MIKKIIIAIVVIVLLLVGYSVFVKKDEAAPGTLSSSATTPTTEETVGREFLGTLLSLNTITLDDSLLANPTFATLQDFTIDIQQEGNQGRPNPFAPIGTDIGAPLTSVSVTTLPATGVSARNATVNGTTDGEGSKYFEWGLTPSFGSQTVPSVGNATEFNAEIRNLTPGTTYHYRAVIKNGSQISNGETLTFTTTR